MTSTTTRPARRITIRQFVPPQHGAWAMLLLPYLAGVCSAGFRWPDLPLLGAWLGGYLLSYFVFQAIKSRRPARYRQQFLIYGLATLVFGVPTVLAEPSLLLFAPVYAVLLAVNAWYAYRRRERALLNDLSSVLQSSLMVFVVGAIAGQTVGHEIAPFLVVFLYLTGAVFYVKTMIRERESPGYHRASIAVHAVALALVCVLGLFATLIFAFLLARAWSLPGRGLTPKRVGLIEIAASVLVFLTALS
ncbi:YwiC-like family protein [Actinoplanes sp. NPDC051851]|uniref:YwiC-like family protein n=1 Tax=Actinoplanes sp. NPDC051851 TaxID=3154753 RepID=UPI003433425B